MKERKSLESNENYISKLRKEAEVVYDGQTREEETVTVRELLEQLKGGCTVTFHRRKKITSFA